MKQDTNNPPAKSPVDDLFARRLGQHSIAPDKAVWGRMQAKMAGQPEARVLAFWQNPTVHRYAAAACVSALLLAGGWLLLRPTDGVTTRQNQVATAEHQVNRADVAKRKMTKQPAQLTNQVATRQTNQPGLQHGTVELKPLIANANQAGLTQKSTERTVANRNEKNAVTSPNQPEIRAEPPIQLAKVETKPASVSTTAVPTKPAAEQVLIVTIAEPDALIEARQAANWSESAEKTLVVDVSAKPTRNNGLFQQLKRVRDGNGLELAGNDDQSLLSRAFQTIKKKTNNKSLKQ